MLDPAVCYRALRTRDARFDGRFFVAVTSTKVYCRPICPARTPRRENCRFVACAAAAQEAGFRPCLRRRPQAPPGTPAWLGTSVTVSRALRLIAEGALDRGSLASLAERLGVGERHLRRLFVRHLGASPIAVAQNRRVLFAKKLIDETGLPMTQVALASGFSSVRRFNDALRSTYGLAPRELRRRATRGGPSPASEIVLRLPFRPPLDWAGLLRFLESRAIPGVESVDAGAYRRTISLDGAQGWVEVTRDEGLDQLRARIQVDDAAVLQRVAERLRQLFDLGADPAVIEDHLKGDRRLRRIFRAHPGLRVPGAWDGFELAVRAILGQQVSVAGATTLAGRLASTFGRPLDGNEGSVTETRLLFPGPERLADAEVEVIGLPRARAEAIRSLARAVASGGLRLDGSPGLEAMLDALVSLPGIGPWTAHYVAMRALREPDAFPSSDLGLRRALATNGQLPREREILRRAEAWRPWRAYAAVALWSDG